MIVVTIIITHIYVIRIPKCLSLYENFWTTNIGLWSPELTYNDISVDSVE
jgi:hypothetical protein